MQRIKSGRIDGVPEHIGMVSGLLICARPTKMGSQGLRQAGLPGILNASDHDSAKGHGRMHEARLGGVGFDGVIELAETWL
jgi:hypothetical protein